MVSNTFLLSFIHILLLFLVQSFGYTDNKVLHDINPYVETEATQHLIHIAYFYYQNCSLTFALSKFVM